MGQIIPVTSGENKQNKALEFAGLFKMAGSSGEKIKIAESESGKNEEDVNNLVPFLQFLNQQMSQINKYSDSNDSSKINENITLEQAASMLQGNVTLEELRQAFINMASSGETGAINEEQNGLAGISIDELLNEVNFLNNKESSGNINPLLTAFLKQINNEEKAINENDMINSLSPSTDKELTEKSGNYKNEAAAINGQNITLNQPGQMTLEMDRNNYFQGDVPSEKTQIKMTDIELKNATGNKSDEVNVDNANFQSELEKEVTDNEIKFNTQNKEKESALKSSVSITQQQKINTFETSDKVAESVPGRINIELAEIKEESKAIINDKASMPVESDKKDSITGNNFHSTISETKESQIARDSLHSEKQQHLNAMNSDSGNKSSIEKALANAAELTDYIKTEQKGKNIPSDKGKEEIPLGSINSAGNTSTSNEKIDNVNGDRIIGQITHEIKEAAANDGGRVKIALNPPSLGKLEMDVTVRNGKVEVVLVADNKDVQQTLNMHIDKLKGSLQNQGLTIDRCDVFMQDNRDEYQQNFGRQAFYQDSGSRQNSNDRQGKSEENVTASPIINTRSKTLSRISTDNISLFA